MIRGRFTFLFALLEGYLSGQRGEERNREAGKRGEALFAKVRLEVSL